MPKQPGLLSGLFSFYMAPKLPRRQKHQVFHTKLSQQGDVGTFQQSSPQALKFEPLVLPGSFPPALKRDEGTTVI